MEFLMNTDDQKRPGKCTRNDAKRYLKNFLDIFE